MQLLFLEHTDLLVEGVEFLFEGFVLYRVDIFFEFTFKIVDLIVELGIGLGELFNCFFVFVTLV